MARINLHNMRDEDFVHDLAFDIGDVDVVDFVNMTEIVHGEVCPEIVDEVDNIVEVDNGHRGNWDGVIFSDGDIRLMQDVVRAIGVVGGDNT